MRNKSNTNGVALLVDGENTASKQIDQILAEAEKFGEATIRRIYGNWASGYLTHWEIAVIKYKFEPVHIIKSGKCKNGSDIALAVGALDLFYNHKIKHFCIVASDSDYLPLVLHLRRGGCQVLGIGRSDTPQPLQDAYSKFVAIDTFLPSIPQVTAVTPVHPVSTLNASTGDPALTHLLQEAYFSAAKRCGGSEWVSVQQLGSTLYTLAPDYKTRYGLNGKKTLTMLVEKRDDLFETRKPVQDIHLEVRLRELQDERAFLAASA